MRLIFFFTHICLLLHFSVLIMTHFQNKWPDVTRLVLIVERGHVQSERATQPNQHDANESHLVCQSLIFFPVKLRASNDEGNPILLCHT